MPKFPSIPRVSIVVPIGSDRAAFENTLISVLECQPAGCEILVSHDGSYDDPFELCDEVQFVVAESAHLVDLVAAGAEAARGRFVHVLADGLRATLGWIDRGLEKFEHFDAGAVAPVIRHAGSGRIVAAGWCDGTDRLCKSACGGSERITAAPKFIGTYLQASFWRREILRSLRDAFDPRDSVEAAYAFDQLIRSAGWRCVLADECEVQSDHRILACESTSIGRGKRLRAIRSCFSGNAGWAQSISASSSAVLANLFRPRYLGESLGQAAAPLVSSQLASQLHREVVAQFADSNEQVIVMPTRGSERVRRAA